MSRVERRTNEVIAVEREVVLLVDSDRRLILLGDHIKSGLWLPSGGHVEPGEDPAETVRRECLEELAIEAQFHPALGPQPLFITVTDTKGSDPHRDVSLWYVLDNSHAIVLTPDRSEFHSVHWWSADEVRASDPTRFDPNIRRMLNKVRDSLWNRPAPVSSAVAD